MRISVTIIAGLVALAALVGSCGGDEAKPLGQRVTDPGAVPTSTPITNPVIYQIRGDVVSTTGGSGTVPAGSSPTPSRTNNTYTVVANDTCAAIATKFSISVDDLKKANRGINSECSNLKVGDVLKIQSTTTPVARPGGTAISCRARTSPSSPGSHCSRTWHWFHCWESRMWSATAIIT